MASARMGQEEKTLKKRVRLLERQISENDMKAVLLNKVTEFAQEVSLGRMRREAEYRAVKYFSKTAGWGIRQMCRVLDISRSAYYRWINREVPEEEQENNLIGQLVTEYADSFKHTLGYRRMTDRINRINSRSYSRNRVRRIMMKLGIRSVIRKKAKKYRSCKPKTISRNVLERNFQASKPNEKWVTDVTEFKIYDGVKVIKLYLSAVFDLYDRSVVAFETSVKNDNRLVLRTLDKAKAANAGAKPIIHSDRGLQYTSYAFQGELERSGMTQSMSRAGCCIDNGPMEGFWGIIKSEMYYLDKFHSVASLRKAIGDYIAYYNYERFQERFGVKTPMEVRLAALDSDNPVQYPIKPNKRIAAFKAKYAA